LGFGLRIAYKRNSNSNIFPPFYTYSTNQNKPTTMDPVSDLNKKVEEVKIEEAAPKAEEKQPEAQPAPKEGQKEKKEKKEKPKKEEPAIDKSVVDPKLFSAIDIRIAEIVECWKVIPFLLSIQNLKICTARRFWFAEKSDRLHLAFKSSSLMTK